MCSGQSINITPPPPLRARAMAFLDGGRFSVPPSLPYAGDQNTAPAVNAPYVDVFHIICLLGAISIRFSVALQKCRSLSCDHDLLM